MPSILTRWAGAVAVCAAVVAVSPASARDIPLRDVTADGTWDCRDETGKAVGVVVVAETTYAYIKPDGILGGYGKLYLIAEDMTTPKFVVMSGYLKDELGSYGLTMRGPVGDIENVSGELYLNGVFGSDGKHYWDCARRVAVGGAPEVVPLTYVVADGTWDCRDQQGGERGVVVLADKAYAFINPDGKLGGYGKLFKLTTDLDLPHYAEISGYLKDIFGSQGFAPRGPRDNPHDLSGQIFLNVILSKDGAGAEDWDCERRIAL